MWGGREGITGFGLLRGKCGSLGVKAHFYKEVEVGLGHCVYSVYGVKRFDGELLVEFVLKVGALA